MLLKETLEKLKNIQRNLLDFMDNDDNIEENFQNLKILFSDQKIQEDQNDLLLLLSLITDIANNHHRGPNFYAKIDKILLYLKNSIQKYFSNSGIFDIFKSNKRILLFLIEEKTLTIDQNITNKITTDKFIKANYPQYFTPEIKPFVNEKKYQDFNDDIDNFSTFKNGSNDFCYINNISKEWLKDIKNELPENFYEQRKIGENDSLICDLIRNDLIKEFITYVNKNNISLDAKITPSIFETNQFLIKKQNEKIQNHFGFGRNEDKTNLSLIEYAAFFGSIQIFKYLMLNNVNLTPSLWLYAIHGNNAELIHILEDNKVDYNTKKSPENQCSFNLEIIIESIKCHHNDLANYFQRNFEINENEIIKRKNIKYHNYELINEECLNKSYFNDLCKYKYNKFCKILLETKQIDIDSKIIFKQIVC